uniref:hypothetical protein n=1 Tax=Cereibacter sphaeroides TaxID=1063 RepID=UPI0015595AEA|nr:hypothetical protein [Cereibacter sphaeroides]
MTKAEERARVKALVVDRLEQAGMVRRRGRTECGQNRTDPDGRGRFGPNSVPRTRH